MSDSTPTAGAHGSVDGGAQPHHPKHRRDDVPVDAEPALKDPLLREFGENPDTSLTG